MESYGLQFRKMKKRFKQNLHFLFVPETDYREVNSIKKYKCTLQVGPLFIQIHTNLNPLKVFTSSR